MVDDTRKADAAIVLSTEEMIVDRLEKLLMTHPSIIERVIKANPRVLESVLYEREARIQREMEQRLAYEQARAMQQRNYANQWDAAAAANRASPYQQDPSYTDWRHMFGDKK